MPLSEQLEKARYCVRLKTPRRQRGDARRFY